MQPGITLRDLVNAIPCSYPTRISTVAKEGKKEHFSGRCQKLKVFQISKLSKLLKYLMLWERSASGCTIKLNKEPIIEYLNSNIVMLRWMITNGYGDPKTLERRAQAMEEWIKNPQLLEADKDEYAAVIEIDLNEIKEPLLACPNDPDDIKPLLKLKYSNR